MQSEPAVWVRAVPLVRDSWPGLSVVLSSGSWGSYARPCKISSVVTEPGGCESANSMKINHALGICLPALCLAGCVYVTADDAPGLPDVSKMSAAARPERINLRVALDCLPTCAFIGTDLAQTQRIIATEYVRSGRFTITPSDDVSRVADVKVSVTREEAWLAPPYCQRTFGFLPASWRDHVRMATTLSGREGMAPRRIEQEADVEYYCHLFLLPWLPFSDEPGALDRTMATLSDRTTRDLAR